MGLCLPRSPQMVIGILGILKAGGCYVPLDPEYPRKRLEYLLEDAQIELVVSEASVAARVRGAGRELLLLSEAQQPEALEAFASGMLESVDRRALGTVPRSSSLSHLYLRLDRCAEGGGRVTPQYRQPCELVVTFLWSGDRGSPVPEDECGLCRSCGGDLPGAECGVPLVIISPVTVASAARIVA